MRVNYADKTKTPANAAPGFEAQLWVAVDNITTRRLAVTNLALRALKTAPTT